MATDKRVIHNQKMIKTFINKILNIIFPQQCLGCGISNTYLCPKCRKQLPYPEIKNDDIWAAISYESRLIKKAIRTLKYKKARKIAQPLAELISERINLTNYRSGTSIVIIPIPVSAKRLRERGFNQAQLIAKHLSDITGLPSFTNVLYKNQHTLSQVETKSREKRLKNLKNSFAVKNAELIKNKTIFIVDDVSTTGATISEARKVLKKAGAKKVVGLVVAR